MAPTFFFQPRGELGAAGPSSIFSPTGPLLGRQQPSCFNSSSHRHWEFSIVASFSEPSPPVPWAPNPRPFLTTWTLPMDLIGFGYAALVTFGSILGYKRRGGVLSLIAGLFIGFLAGYGAYRVSNDKRDVKLSLFTAFFLTTMMGVRFKRSKKIMPAGLVAGLSLLMILRLQLLLLWESRENENWIWGFLL